ncbi:MAG: hypothetical protein JWN94_4168 [Betaproteobacteria bacterium]|nr:hypothetical protein [Betaproteobacteria bacterium]
MIEDDVPSPCIRICVVDETRAICRGCYRTLDEISRWAGYPRAQKLALLEDLARRKASAPFPPHL